MSNRSFVLTFLFSGLFMVGAALSSRAAAPTSAATERTTVAESRSGDVASDDEQDSSLTCSDILCHSTVDCSTGTTPCGSCVIPPGGFFGHCVLKK